MGEHTLRVAGSTTDLDENWIRVRLECDRCDLSGMISGSPAAGMLRLVRLLADAHRAGTQR